jgi:8-oxo-dGTP diphosphatase
VTADIIKAGLLVFDKAHRILLCRKSRDTSLLITPGGRIEANESAEECLVREISEELGSKVSLRDLCYVGTYRDVAAGSTEKIVEIQLYSGTLSGPPVPQSEIAELVWFGPADDKTQLAPSIRNQILPDLIKRGMWKE